MHIVSLFIMGLIIILATLAGLGLGVAFAANIVCGKAAPVRPPANKRPRGGMYPGSRPAAAKQYAEPSGAPERPVILRALNDDVSRTEFDCLADGSSMDGQIRRQRERSNDSYNILGKKLGGGSGIQAAQEHARSSMAANRGINDIAMHQNMVNQQMQPPHH